MTKHTKNGGSPMIVDIPKKPPHEEPTKPIKPTVVKERHCHRCVYFNKLNKGCSCKSMPHVYECFGSAFCDYYLEKQIETYTETVDFISIGTIINHKMIGLLTITNIYNSEVVLTEKNGKEHTFNKSSLRRLYEKELITIK